MKGRGHRNTKWMTYSPSTEIRSATTWRPPRSSATASLKSRGSRGRFRRSKKNHKNKPSTHPSHTEIDPLISSSEKELNNQPIFRLHSSIVSWSGTAKHEAKQEEDKSIYLLVTLVVESAVLGGGCSAVCAGVLPSPSSPSFSSRSSFRSSPASSTQ